jgi:hypothetical protein
VRHLVQCTAGWKMGLEIYSIRRKWKKHAEEEREGNRYIGMRGNLGVLKGACRQGGGRTRFRSAFPCCAVDILHNCNGCSLFKKHSICVRQSILHRTAPRYHVDILWSRSRTRMQRDLVRNGERISSQSPPRWKGRATYLPTDSPTASAC